MFTVICNLEFCLGCKTCEFACAIEHSPEKNLISAISKSKPRIDVVYVSTPVPVNCRHCENAPCIKVCPTSAIKKDERDAVIIDEKLCIGCRNCVIVCPFGAISFDSFAYKCDLCAGRKIPACVEACPTGALKYENVETLVKFKRVKYAKNLLL